MKFSQRSAWLLVTALVLVAMLATQCAPAAQPAAAPTTAPAAAPAAAQPPAHPRPFRLQPCHLPLPPLRRSPPVPHSRRKRPRRPLQAHLCLPTASPKK